MGRVAIKPNCNYHIASGRDILKPQSERFREYRKRWVNFPKKFMVSDFPMHLDIESTNICNLKCPYCAVSSNSWGSSKKGMVSFPLFKKIIEEGADNGLYSIKLSLRGEPLLHKQLPKMISFAKEKGIIDIYFNTNGVLLDEKMCNTLVDIGLYRISISADGWNKASFERNRLGAKFNVVYNNVLLLRKTRDKRGVDFPKIRIQAVMLKEIREHWDEYVRLWQPLADELGYIDARLEGVGIDHRGLRGDWACPFLWQRMTILWDGTILPCLLHGVKESKPMTIGNARDMQIKDAWHSQKSSLLRSLHKKGESHEIESCNYCSYRALEIGKLNGIAEEVRA